MIVHTCSHFWNSFWPMWTRYYTTLIFQTMDDKKSFWAWAEIWGKCIYMWSHHRAISQWFAVVSSDFVNKIYFILWIFLLNHSCNSDSIIHFVTLAATCIFPKEIGSLCPLTWCNYVNSFWVGIMIYTANCIITLFYHKVISWHVDLCLKELFLQFLMSTWVEYFI